jgi:HSP20 family protein
MAIIRWDPYRDLMTLQERMNRMFDESYRSRGGEESLSTRAWAPAVDIYETKEALVVKAELPEVKKDDIDVKIDNGILTIQGERKCEEVKDEQVHRRECQYGFFSRSFSLPTTVDPNKINANYKDGVLTVSIPRKEETKPRQIEIR